MQHNKLHITHLALALVFCIVSALFTDAIAQNITSRTLEQHFRLFNEHKATDREQALHYAQLIEADIDSAANDARVAEVFDYLAEHNEVTLHRYSHALKLRERSRNIYAHLNDTTALVRTYADLSRLYLRNGDYHNAFSSSSETLNKGRELGDSTSVREAYIVLEQVTYYYHNSRERAMEYNHLVTDNYEGYDQARQAVRALNNRFNYAIEPAEADEIFRLTDSICRSYGIDDQMINVYLNTSMYKLQHEDMAAAAEYLDVAKSLVSNFKEEGYYYSALGFYHLIVGNTTQAIAALKHSIELLSNGEFDTKNVHSYFLLQDIYRTEGRYREAYDALMAFAETYTRQNNTDSAIELSKLINDLELQHTEEQYRQRQLQLEQQQEYDKLLWRIHACSLGVLVVLILLLFSRYRLQRKNSRLMKAKAEQELNHKNEIIRLHKLQQYQEQSSLSKLRDELSLIANGQDNRSLRAELKRIIMRMHKDNDSGGDWLEVEKVMESNNDAFFENLISAFPNLTKNERKLCIFIHMNLSTKEISKISQQSIGSINIARSRLRKKFGITGDDKSLIAFLDRFDTKKKEE